MSDPAVRELGAGRFRVIERLGAGGMGVVYAAWDSARAERVAVKTLRALSPERLVLFKNEFRSLADVGHPNLVTLHELCEVDGEWLVAMELVDGVPLLEWLRGDPCTVETVTADASTVAGPRAAGTSPLIGPTALPAVVAGLPGRPGRVDEERLRAALEQIVHGLDAIHRSGQVHRDIKPSNVLVTPGGRVVILDFGLVGAAGTSDGRIMGSPGYMAPEQAGGEAVGPAADWYAVGAVLYQALTGRLPFLGPSSDVLRLKRTVDPLPASAIDPGAPEWAVELAAALLRRDPGARADGAAILAALGAPRLRGQEPGFVGREAELAALDRGFADAAHAPVTVRVRGPAGIGKSATVAEWLARLARSEPALVPLVGRCYERERVPYKGVDGVMDALAGALEASALPVDPADLTTAAAAFPSLGGLAPDAPGPALAEPAQERRRRLVAVRRLVAAVAARRRVVIVVDDAHWADRDGLSVLAEVVAPPAAPPVLVVLTERVGGRGAGDRVEPLLLPWTGDVRELALPALTASDGAELARRAGAAGERAAAVAASAGGHPLYIAELARAGGAGAAATLEDALAARHDALLDDERAVLDVAALAGRPIAAEVVAAVAEVDAAAWRPLVARLRAQQLVRTGGSGPVETLDVFHGRVRDAIVPRLAPDRRTALHARLAAALEGRADRDPEAVAGHWLEAGQPARARGLLVRAAAAAEQALAFDQAARSHRMLLALEDDPAAAHRTRVALGTALANAGRGGEAADELLAAAAAGGDDALDLRRRAAEQLLRSGHVDRGLDVLDGVVRAVGIRLPGGPTEAGLRILWSRARLAVRGLELGSGVRPARRDAVRARLEVGWSAAVGLSMIDTVRGGELLLRTLLEALAAGDRERAGRALAVEAGHIAASGAAASERVRELLAAAADVGAGSAHVEALVTGAAGVAAYLEGRFAAARALASRALEQTARLIGATWERDTSAIVAAWADVYLGRLAEVGERLPRLCREADQTDDRYLGTSLRSGTLVMVPLCQGDPARARAEASAAIARWSHRGFLHQHWDDLLGQGEIDLYEGDAAAALARVEGGWKELVRSFVLLIEVSRCEAWYLRARAALTRAGRGRAGDRGRLLATVKKGVRALDGPAPWTGGLADLLRAGTAALAGDLDTARFRLASAADALDRAGLALHAAVARRRLAGLVGGDEGRALAAAAADYAARERIAELERIAGLLCPWPE